MCTLKPTQFGKWNENRSFYKYYDYLWTPDLLKHIVTSYFIYLVYLNWITNFEKDNKLQWNSRGQYISIQFPIYKILSSFWYNLIETLILMNRRCQDGFEENARYPTKRWDSSLIWIKGLTQASKVSLGHEDTREEYVCSQVSNASSVLHTRWSYTDQ